MSIDGYLDVCTDTEIRGWAWDSDRPDSRLTVRIRDGDELIADVVAQEYRADLKAVGIGDGAYGYVYRPPLPINDRRQISVSVADTDTQLPRAIAVDPIPAPSEDLIFRVVGHKDVAGFLSSGGFCVSYIRRALQVVGVDLDSHRKRVLDWGCGCGRIARHWAPYLGQIDLYGCDIFEPSIRWCQAHIPFGSFSLCGVAPPLPFPDGSFDVIYSASVLTHLTFQLHYLWMAELWRLLSPDGVAVLTTMGPSMLPPMLVRLANEDPANRSGTGVIMLDEEPFVYIQGDEGTNYTSVVESASAFRMIFSPFTCLFSQPRYGIIGIQDAHVIKKGSDGPLGYIPFLLEEVVTGTEYNCTVPLHLDGHRNLSVLVGATNLFSPATIQLSVSLPGSDEVYASKPVRIPDKVSWTSLEAAYSLCMVENIPQHTGTAAVRITVCSDFQMQDARIVLKNAFLF